MGIWMLAAALAVETASAESGAAATIQAVSPTMSAAIANKARVKTGPSFVDEPKSVRPDIAVSAGEFGDVVLSGIIAEDGKVLEAQIAVSSRSPAIDAAALASVPAMRFEPARGASGEALSIPAKLSLEYGQIDSRGPKGLAQYRCDQFVRDYDWWYRTWPADKHDRIFATLRGFVVLADLRSGQPTGDFELEWKAAVEACRKSPEKLMLDTLIPHGPLIRGMTRK